MALRLDPFDSDLEHIGRCGQDVNGFIPDAAIGHRDEVCVVNADAAQLHHLDLLLRGDGLAPTRCFR